MFTSTRKLAAVLAAVALTTGGSLGIAEAAKQGSGSKSPNTARPGHKRGGPIPTAALTKIAETLGVTSAQLKSALDASRPAKPTGGKGERGPQGFATDIASALGVEVSAVTPILEANRPAKPANRPARGTKPPAPDHTKLIAALASGLDIDESTVKTAIDKLEAAHKAEHEERHTAMYAAVAEALGKSAADVQAAFEANRPAKPTS